MDVLEAVNKRKSIRAFKSDPVPEGTLKKIVQGALHAPSASNSQPWELAVVSGAKLEEIKKAILETADRPTVDLPELSNIRNLMPQGAPPSWPAPSI